MGTATFRTTDGAEYAVPVSPDVPLLDAAADAGSTLLSLCRKGTCGVCRASVVSGDVELGEHTEDALSAAERAEGKVLLCCATTGGDAVIDLPYDSTRVLSGKVPERKARIEQLDRWPGDIVRIAVQVLEDDEHGAAMQFDAGQFAELTPPDGKESRAYSFSSTGTWDGTAEFLVKLRPGGYFSEYLRTRAMVGDVLGLRGPQGAFTVRENGPRPRWMVCGGTGLAPLLSMLRRMAEWGETQESLLILGVNLPEEVFGESELADLREQLPMLRTLFPVMKPDDTWDGPVGTSVDVLADELDRVRTTGSELPDIYLCGSPGFLVAAREAATARGVPDEQVYEERILAN